MNWDERKYFSCNRYPYSGVDLSVVKNLADDSKNIADDSKNINIAKQSQLGNALFRYL